ncbi:hypothetical protein PsAD2_02316 [Pseudovibrio axinellae]|uniref:Permease n=1 Tax=Pseudovibrio axinellae TaxID=989403 RepID=A0A165YFJ1_9HYPH|nr:hypothetical protein [Pseudovibrio axinellae]KZL18800.1 hypothetical protein PsAD2_02316 [Pseudovibrio axinellae]SEP92382.1 hypothetical protein SAMN05421798_101725 [Pseudovibrio axinellae]
MNTHDRRFDVIEALPSLAFLSLLRLGMELELAGWIGAGLAAAALLYLHWAGARYNPILLGINVHLLIVTPVIVAIFKLNATALGEALTSYSYQGVLITIFVVGVALTLTSRHGFIGLEGASSSVKRQSLFLLLAALCGIVWSFTYGGASFVGVAVPIISLFVIQRVVRARVT